MMAEDKSKNSELEKGELKYKNKLFAVPRKFINR